MQQQIRALGWVKDPVDARDHDALKILAPVTVPKSFVNYDIVDIVDQQQIGSCTCNAAGQTVFAAQVVEKAKAATDKGVDEAIALQQALNSTSFMSRLFAYFLARATSGDQKEDSGTFLRLVYFVLNKYGFPPESAWPYIDDGKTFAKMPSAEAFREAYDQRDSAANQQKDLISYSRISANGSGRIDAIKLAVSQRHLVSFGTLVTEKFCSDMSANNFNPIELPTANDALAGGHAMAIGGYDDEGALIVNSWGKGYGKNGWCKFSWPYIAWAKTDDLWIVKAAPIY